MAKNIINAQTIAALNTSVSMAFNQGMGSIRNDWQIVAMEVKSSSSANIYPKLDGFRGIREWIGDRILNRLTKSAFTILNKDFEGTVVVDRNDIEDDEIGIYQPLAQQLGQDAANFPNRLVYGLLKNGAATTGPDGQYFFDADHLSFDINGNEISASNIQTGTEPAWYLIDDRKILKPIIFQNRKPFNLQTINAETDPNVFMRKEFIYGVDGRCNVGFGLWQLAYMSTAPLTPDNYAAARAAMGSLKNEKGDPLEISPTKLLVPAALESAARQIANSELVSDGSTTISNPWKGTVEAVVVPYL